MDDIRTMTREYGQYQEYSDFFSTQLTIAVKTVLRGNPLRSDGVDRTGDASQIRVSATRKTTGRGGQMMVGWNRTHSPEYCTADGS